MYFTAVRLAVLGSTRGTDMQAIIDAIARKELNAGTSFAPWVHKNVYKSLLPHYRDQARD